VKVGDLVRYECFETGENRVGYITDTQEDNAGWFMYEVICTDPYDRGWFSDLMLDVISKAGRK
jgi:hypothetical protein